MGRDLLQSNATFRKSIRFLDRVLRDAATNKNGNTHCYSIEEELLKPGKKSQIGTTTLSQPLCTAVQLALVDTFKSLGVTADAVVGHSSGEIAAAYAAGALTAREAIVTAHYRGAVTSLQKREGAMAAMGLGWGEEAEQFMIPHATTLACDNSPRSITISGDADAVKKVVASTKKSRPDVLVKLLAVDKAYHSNHMAEIAEDYRSLIASEVTGKRPSRGADFFSSVTGTLLGDTDGPLNAEYWRDNLVSPVKFRQAVESILQREQEKTMVFLEIGPRGALAVRCGKS